MSASYGLLEAVKYDESGYIIRAIVNEFTPYVQT